jgi:hypothetical protein
VVSFVLNNLTTICWGCQFSFKIDHQGINIMCSFGYTQVKTSYCIITMFQFREEILLFHLFHQVKQNLLWKQIS